MTGKTDEIKGRVKEAAGAITDDDKLRREGKIDQATGKIKQAADKVVEKVKQVAEDANNVKPPIADGDFGGRNSSAEGPRLRPFFFDNRSA